MMAACESAPVVVDDIPPPDTAIERELLVLPLSGLSPGVGVALGEMMAWGMREAGYQARSSSIIDGSSPIITGWIEEASDGGDVVWLNINWVVYKTGGGELGSYRQETAVSRDGWAHLSPDTLAVIVAQAVPSIHEVVKADIYPDGMPEVAVAGVEQPEMELIAQKPDTIVVSGDGISHIDSSGTETKDTPLSIAAEPTFAPSTESVLAAQVDYPEGFASGGSAPSVSEAPLPTAGSESDAGVQGTIQVVPEPAPEPTLEFMPETVPEPSAESPLEFMPEATPEPTAESQLEFMPETTPESSLEFMPESTGALVVDPLEDVERLTPESAALVTTVPELTIAETLDPQRDPMVDESLVELGLTPQEVGETATAMQPTVAPSVSASSQQAPVPAAAINPQPTLSDGNAALGFVRPVFLVRNVVGAPGDGNLALRTAVLRALRAADAMVTDDPTQASYTIQGSVQMAVPFAGRQHTRILWLVTTITGEEVGTATQENDVPQGSLDGKWGKVAQVIADAAIPGIAQLFDTGLDSGTAKGNLAQPDLPHLLNDPAP